MALTVLLLLLYTLLVALHDLHSTPIILNLPLSAVLYPAFMSLLMTALP